MPSAMGRRRSLPFHPLSRGTSRRGSGAKTVCEGAINREARGEHPNDTKSVKSMPRDASLAPAGASAVAESRRDRNTREEVGAASISGREAADDWMATLFPDAPQPRGGKRDKANAGNEAGARESTAADDGVGFAMDVFGDPFADAHVVNAQSMDSLDMIIGARASRGRDLTAKEDAAGGDDNEKTLNAFGGGWTLSDDYYTQFDSKATVFKKKATDVVDRKCTGKGQRAKDATNRQAADSVSIEDLNLDKLNVKSRFELMMDERSTDDDLEDNTLEETLLEEMDFVMGPHFDVFASCLADRYTACVGKSE